MGIYTTSNNPSADSAVQNVIDMVVQNILNIMGRDVDAIVLMGGYGKGEGGIYKNGNGFKLVNDLDLAVFVEKDFKRIKKKYNKLLKDEAEKILPFAQGLKQIDIDITNSWRYRYIPNMVVYYEMLHGHKILYGNLNLKKIPKIRAEQLSNFDGANYFFTRGSGLLMAAIYFLTDNLDRSKDRENFQIELQKACQAIGDALLLLNKKYHYSYSERLRRFKKKSVGTNIPSKEMMNKIEKVYCWGVERKLQPSFVWPGTEIMIKKWFEIRNLFLSFFLWFESKRLQRQFQDWMAYSSYTYTNGVSEPYDLRFRNYMKNLNKIIQSKTINTQILNQILKKSNCARLLPMLPLLLSDIKEDFSFGKRNIAFVKKNLMAGGAKQKNISDIEIIKQYLEYFHPGGVTKNILKM